jgi:hypothetical protein
MSIGQQIPLVADDFVTVSQATTGAVGQKGQILIGIIVNSSTAGVLNIGLVARGSIGALGLTAGAFVPFAYNPKSDGFSLTAGGGTFSATLLFQNP